MSGRPFHHVMITVLNDRARLCERSEPRASARADFPMRREPRASARAVYRQSSSRTSARAVSRQSSLRTIACGFFVCCAVIVANVEAQTIVYVDEQATGPVHDGSSWCSAFVDLQDALDVAGAGDEI